MKKLLSLWPLALVLAGLALTSTGCRAAKIDERLDRLENRVTALEAKQGMK